MGPPWTIRGTGVPPTHPQYTLITLADPNNSSRLCVRILPEKMGHRTQGQLKPRTKKASGDSVRLLGWPDSYTLCTQGKIQPVHRSFRQGKNVFKHPLC